MDGKRLVWCLDLTWAGTVYRVASEPIDVKANDGTTHSYTGGLEVPRVTESLGRLKFSAPDLSASIRALLPVSVATLRSRGHDWLSATAAVYLTTVETRAAGLTVPTSDLTHAEMWQVIAGRVRSPSWGDSSRLPGAVEFTITSNAWESPGALLQSAETITAALWPGADADVIGKRYPVIIGRPGVYLDASGTETYGAGSPAYVIARSGASATTLLVAGHPPSGGQQAHAIDSDGDAYAASAVRSADADGNPVTIIDISGAPGSFRVTGSRFFVAWSGAGGVGSDVSASTLEEAPEVAAYMLARAGLPIDAPAWLALKGRIPRVLVGGYVNDDATAYDYAHQHVLPLMPVAYRHTRQGLAPVVYDPAHRTADTVAHVRTVDTPGHPSSGDWTPIGPMTLETEPEDVVIQYDVTMATDVRTGEPPRSVSWVGTGAGPVSRYIGPRSIKGKSGSIYLDHAATRGASGIGELSLSQVWDTPSIDAVASWRTRLASMPTYSMDYSAPIQWAWLQVGDQITVTDPARGLDGAICMIEARSVSSYGVEFTLVYDEDPVRDQRAIQ
jgi:hypothetical protein